MLFNLSASLFLLKAPSLLTRLIFTSTANILDFVILENANWCNVCLLQSESVRTVFRMKVHM